MSVSVSASGLASVGSVCWRAVAAVTWGGWLLSPTDAAGAGSGAAAVLGDAGGEWLLPGDE